MPSVDFPLLADLGDTERRRLLAAGEPRQFGRREVVFHENDPGDSMHLILSGRLAVRATTPLGDVATLSLLGAGQAFGELALLDPDARRTATVVAPKTTRTLAALELWRGPALAGVTGSFVEPASTRWTERRLMVLEQPIDADLQLGHHHELIPELTALVDEHPLRERLRAMFMTALYRAGRQAEALAVYRQTRELLVEELGVDPSPELQRLEQAILQADPALEPDLRPVTSLPLSVVSPAQLPADIADFTRRAQQVAQIRDALAADPAAGPWCRPCSMST